MLRAALNDALKDAMKGKDKCAVSTLRLINAAIKDREIAARGKGQTEGIGEDQILGVLGTMVRQRRESIEAYTQGGRRDLADQEAQEITIVERFMPKMLSDEETTSAAREVIVEIGAAGIKDMGRTMAALKERYPGRMDFAKVSAAVKEVLG